MVFRLRVVWFALHFPLEQNSLLSLGNVTRFGSFPELGVPSWGPQKEDYSIWGSTLVRAVAHLPLQHADLHVSQVQASSGFERSQSLKIPWKPGKKKIKFQLVPPNTSRRFRKAKAITVRSLRAWPPLPALFTGHANEEVLWKPFRYWGPGWRLARYEASRAGCAEHSHHNPISDSTIFECRALLPSKQLCFLPSFLGLTSHALSKR